MRSRWVSIVVVVAVLLGSGWAWQAKRRHDQAEFVAGQRATATQVRVTVDVPQRLLIAQTDEGPAQRVDLTQLEMMAVHEQPGDGGQALLTLQTHGRLVTLPYYGLDAWRVVQQLPPLLHGLDVDVAATQLSRFEQERDLVCVLWASPAREVALEKAGQRAGGCRPRTGTR